MKKKVFLRRIFHHKEWRLAIIFDYDIKMAELVKTIEGVQWSSTNTCWHAPDNEQTLKKILGVFRELADIDISAIVSGETVKIYQPEESFQTEDKEKAESYPFPEEPTGQLKSDYWEKATEPAAGPVEFEPVRFTIGEPDGRLIIKFTGRYDPLWIKEMKTYGKCWYKSSSKEWLISWSQLTVDSLSDYFTSRGIEVIVKKREVSKVLKEVRVREGGQVRGNIIGDASKDGIETVRRHLREKRYSNRTIEAYTAHLELFFKYHNEKAPHEIDDEDIKIFIEDYILKLGYSASYQNIMISAIKTYYILCGGRIVHSDSFERPRRIQALPKVFSKEEVMKIFSSTRNVKHKLMLWLIYSCGLRRSEVINIKLTDLDRDRSVLHIREAKGNVDRMVPVSQKVWDKIDIYTKSYIPVTYLFEGQTGGKYSVESVYSVFKQSLKRSGIKKEVGVHCLRHSYATHLHESGLDIRYIQELLGHKSSRTTEIYTHVSRRNLFAIRSPIDDMDIG
jgi:site-specific recombinase XerD